MASKQVKETKQPQQMETPKHVDVYSYNELVEAYRVFGVPKECVMAALKFYQVKQADIETAKNYINKFMRRVIV